MPEAPVLLFNNTRTQLNHVRQKFEIFCKLWEQPTILQTAHSLNHVTSYPGCDLPSRGVQKGTHFDPRLQNDPFWSHVTSDPGCDLPSRGVQKETSQKRPLFGVPVFGPVLPRSSRNLPQIMVPGPKSTFWTMLHDFLSTFYHLKGVPFQPFFIWGHFLDPFGW